MAASRDSSEDIPDPCLCYNRTKQLEAELSSHVARRRRTSVTSRVSVSSVYFYVSVFARCQEGYTSPAAMQAAGALTHISQADTSSRAEIGSAGGVKSLVSMLSKGVASDTEPGARRSSVWATSKACEQTVAASGGHLHVNVVEDDAD